MKQADIEAMARNMALFTSPYEYSGVAKNIARQLTASEKQLLEHLQDNPHWWNEKVYMPEVNPGDTLYPTCLGDVVYEIIFEIVFETLLVVHKDDAPGKHSDVAAHMRERLGG